MKISIAIPTWESHGRGKEFLDDLLRTIEIQTFKDFEIVISDHSVDNSLLDVVYQFKDKFQISYFKNEDKRGNGPFNTNRVISKCSGDIIKIMFQDDFFYDDESLQKIYNCFAKDINWLLCGSNHTINDGHNFYWDLYPSWNDNILKGTNTLGSPSCLSFKKHLFEKVKFDENLVMLMDCEYFYSLRKEFGDPYYLNDVLITNRVHKNQISLRYCDNNDYRQNIENEIEYCLTKHSI